MDDYISRDEAIEKIRYEGIYGSGFSDKEREDDVVDMIWSIPAADVKPVVRGKWIDEGTFADNNNAHAYMCSNCCSHVIEYPEEIKDQHFCYNCGADMREE
jgi:uncharacterized protein YlaI